MSERRDRQDARLEMAIGRLLRLGVLGSSLLLAIGLVLELARPGAGAWLLSAGIIVLIAAPAGRVVLSLAENLIARNWTFVTLTAIVLVELAASLVAALVFHRRL